MYNLAISRPILSCRTNPQKCNSLEYTTERPMKRKYRSVYGRPNLLYSPGDEMSSQVSDTPFIVSLN